MRPNINLDEIKKNTMELLGTTNPDDVSYINEDFFNGDFTDQTFVKDETVKIDKDSTVAILDGPWYGNNMATDGAYYYYNGNPNNGNTSESAGCGNYRYMLPMAHWHHAATGTTCGSHYSQRVMKFTRR